MTEPTTGRVAELRGIISRLAEILSTVLQNLHVKLQRLDGSTEPVPLLGAREKADVTADEMRRAAEAIVVDGRLKTHNSESLKKERARPETFREWMAALTSGQFAVASAAAMGAIASRVALVGIVAGIVGLSAYNGGAPGLIDRARSVELSLIAQSGDAEVASAVPDAAAAKPECGEPTECADDETTEARARAAYRAAAAAALQTGIAGSRIADIRSSAFRLGAVDARRAILENSSRPAAASLDPGAEKSEGYRPARQDLPPDHAAGPVDEAFDRRVRALRSNTRAWDQLRAWAAHPVTPDHAADAWLRTAVGEVQGPQLHQLQEWAEQSSTEFTKTLVETGDADRARRAIHPPGDPHLHVVGTARDARLFRDFSADAAERVNSRMNSYDSGLEDPGSLRRTATSAHSAANTSFYDRLFAASSSTPEMGSPGSFGGGGPGGMRAGASPRPGGGVRFAQVAARSFGSIRFSARVGGVVFGRPPDNIDTPPAVTSIRAETKQADRMQLIVGFRDGSKIALGPYHPAIIHHALAYVADGRVVVSTLPMPFHEEGQEVDVPARRVAVHPAFEDTAFACDAIQIDRFVDTFTMADEAPAGSTLGRIREGRDAVTALGLLLSPEVPAEAAEREPYLKTVADYSRSCDDDTQCFPLKHYSDIGVDFRRAMSLLQCLHGAKSPEAHASCWDNYSVLPSTSYFMVDSGVREQPYSLDTQLNYVTGHDKTGDSLWPIEFMVQAVPLSTEEEDIGARIGQGRDPWQFPKLSAQIQRQIATQTAADKGAREVYGNVRDFIALQRFFRTGLDGNLGPNFPLDDLVKLSAQTRPYIRVKRNEKWNLSNSLLTFLVRVESATEASMQEALPSLEGRCHAAAASALASERGQTSLYFRKGFWSFMANLDDNCGQQPELAKVRAIQAFLRRQELIDEMLAYESSGPPRAALACAAL